MAKEKKRIAPNEASLLRWLACIVVAVVIANIISVPWVLLEYMGPYFLYEGLFAKILPQASLIFGFVAMFIGTVIAIRLVAKTSLRDFVLGVGGRMDHRQNLTVLGLYLLGMLISFLPFIGNITLRGVDAPAYLLTLVLLILFVWMQTSFEELIFRGIFIRYACKNDITCSKKAVGWGIVSSLLFMAMHFANPEILSQSGAQLVIAAFPYFLSGMALYFVDIYFKSLMPGLIIHWINNFINFALITSVVSAGSFPSLFVDNTPPTGLYYLVTTALAYLPIYVYIVRKILLKRRAERSAA